MSNIARKMTGPIDPSPATLKEWGREKATGNGLKSSGKRISHYIFEGEEEGREWETGWGGGKGSPSWAIEGEKERMGFVWEGGEGEKE